MRVDEIQRRFHSWRLCGLHLLGDSQRSDDSAWSCPFFLFGIVIFGSTCVQLSTSPIIHLFFLFLFIFLFIKEHNLII